MGLAAAVVILLTGCGSPPVSEKEFAERMDSVGGVEGAYISDHQNLPFIFTYEATVQLKVEVSSAHVSGVFEAFEEYDAFDRYSLHSELGSDVSVSWSAASLPDSSVREAIATVWPAAMRLPEHSIVDMKDWASPLDVEVGSSAHADESSALTHTEPTALAAVEFAAIVAQAEPDAAFELTLGSVWIKSGLARCPAAPDVVDALIAGYEVIQLQLSCDDAGNSLVAAIDSMDTDAAQAQLAPLADDAGVSLVVTPADFTTDAGADTALREDVNALMEASRQVDGYPHADTTDSGIAFEAADEATVRAMVEHMSSTPGYDRRTLELMVGVPGDALTIPKAVGGPLYLEQILAIDRAPNVNRWAVGIHPSDPSRLKGSVVVSADDVDQAARALRDAGLGEMAGLTVSIRVVNFDDHRIGAVTAVVHSDGSLESEHPADSELAQPFLDAWAGA